jgi:hypothetical protein
MVQQFELVMNLSKREILAWASSDVTGQRSQLFASGAAYVLLYNGIKDRSVNTTW